MKRLHIHLSVSDLARSIEFYNALFGCEPAVIHDDYAKWMLDDPRVNFAISTRGAKPGLDHLGFQVDEESELAELKHQLDATQAPVETQEGAACCYAESNKHWIIDPQGIAWESFHTLKDIPTFNQQAAKSDGENPFACRPADNSSSSCCG